MYIYIFSSTGIPDLLLECVHENVRVGTKSAFSNSGKHR